jgi:hypothetical protein
MPSPITKIEDPETQHAMSRVVEYLFCYFCVVSICTMYRALESFLITLGADLQE